MHVYDVHMWQFPLKGINVILPTPGEAEAKAMPGRLYIHTINNNNNQQAGAELCQAQAQVGLTAELILVLSSMEAVFH